MTFLPEKVTFFALFLRMKKARKPDKINVFGLAGDSETRTHDPLNAIQVLSQLSYTPKRCRYLITHSVNMQVDFCITSKFLGKVSATTQQFRQAVLPLRFRRRASIFVRKTLQVLRCSLSELLRETGTSETKKTASPYGEAAQSLSVINIPEGQEFCRPSSRNPESKAHTMFFRLHGSCLRCLLL